MDVKKKILFILPSLRGGGAEKVMSTILKFLDSSKYEITLALVKKEGQFLKDIPEHINIYDLQVNRSRYAIFKIIKLIYRTKPNTVFSTLGYLNLLIAIIRPILPKNIKFIARESNTVSIQNKREKYPKLFDFLYKSFYNRFDIIVAQSQYMKEDLVENFSIITSKIHVIYNPVDIDTIKIKSTSEIELFDASKINLLAVGRLSYQKGFENLLHALSQLDETYHLTIIGDGQEKENLLDLVKNLNLTHKVDLIGFQDNPYKFMKQANLYILSSWYEGLPNVVLEANSLGLPAIAFACPGGTSEIINDGVNGFLIECGNIEKMVESIKKANDYRFNINIIKESVVTRNSVVNIIGKYENIL
jgi:glycosyltransferase involved in cell wall biosynthesis